MENPTPFEKEEKSKKAILEYVLKRPHGEAISQITEGTGISRKTVEKHLQVLYSENEIYMKQFGPTRMFYPNHRKQHLEFLQFNYGKRTIWVNILENPYGKYLLFQQKQKEGEDWTTKGTLTVPLDKIQDFLKEMNTFFEKDRVQLLIKKEIGPKS